MGKLTEEEGEKNTDESELGGVGGCFLSDQWIWDEPIGHSRVIAVIWNQWVSSLENTENEEFPHCNVCLSLPSIHHHFWNIILFEELSSTVQF